MTITQGRHGGLDYKICRIQKCHNYRTDPFTTGATLTYAEANKRTPVQLAIGLIDEEITFSPKQEKLAADYEPVLVFSLNVYDGGQPSYGTAEGSVMITSVRKIQ